MNKKIILIICIILIGSFNASAEIIVGNGSQIKSDYNKEEFLSGKLNLSIINEPINKEIVFKFLSEEKKIILNLLLKNQTINFTCSPSDCTDDFKIISSGENSKSFSLANEKPIGFILNGNNVNVIDGEISFSSNAGANCVSQLSVDILGDKRIEWENNKKLGESCFGDKVSQCYRQDSFTNFGLIGQEPYCEKIKIGKAPAFEIKALMKAKEGASFQNRPLIASIYGTDKELKGTCELPKPSTIESEESCEINYVSKSDEEHFICISIKEGIENDGYSLKAKTSGNFCGFRGSPRQTSTPSADYAIKVSPKKYDSVGTFVLNNEIVSSQTGNTLSSIVNDFIIKKYKKNCPSEGCIVPILLSGISQEINVNNINIRYENSAFNEVTENKIYLLEKTPAIVSMQRFGEIDLSRLNISLPQTAGNYTFSIIIGNTEIMKKNITIREKEEKIAEQLSPKIVTAAVPTKFIVFISSEKNKSLFNFEWDFGDNSPKETTNINKVEHVYNSIGNYSIKVKVFEGRVEKDVSEFKITVHAPIKAINETLKEYKERIRNFKTKKSSLPQNYIGPLNRTINIEEVESKVNKIENDYKSLLSSREQSEQTFIAIMDELSKEIEVPWDLKPSSISNINFIYELNDINLNNFKELFQANYNESMEEEYKNEIFSWFIENIETNINHKTYSVYFDEVNEPFVSEFEISIIPKKSLQGKGYLVIERDYNDISFKEEYNISKGTGITGIEIDLSKRNDIRFSISENINVFSLPLFISPEFSKLDLSQPALTKKKGWGFWTKFSIGFTIVMIIFLVIYILLQEWYKRNYESYLFKNKNDLYNLIYFIKNAKSRKLSNEQIKANLSKAKWKSEQINYAINKFEGKRIGMWEIPIFRKSERKKIEIEMMKRQNFVRI